MLLAERTPALRTQVFAQVRPRRRTLVPAFGQRPGEIDKDSDLSP